MKPILIFHTLAALATPFALGQQSLESAFRTTGPQVVAVFEPQRAVLQTSSAVIQQGRKQLVYGVVISADGAILTKASEIEGETDLNVIIDRQTYRDVTVVATDPVWDVALLRVSAENLTPVIFPDPEEEEIALGSWIVANGATTRLARRALAGVVSANPRPIPVEGGAVLGVVIEAHDGGLLVKSVVEGGGASLAGIEEGDVIVEVGGKEVKSPEDIVESLEGKSSGEKVEIHYLRGGKREVTQAPLIARGELFAEEMMTRNDVMSGDFSRRRSGFPRILQHDILGNSSTSGGPIIDLAGRCVGMNIARANRAESFAIPAREVQEIAARLLETP